MDITRSQATTNWFTHTLILHLCHFTCVPQDNKVDAIKEMNQEKRRTDFYLEYYKKDVRIQHIVLQRLEMKSMITRLSV